MKTTKMIKFIAVFIISIFIFIPTKPIFSKDIPQEKIDKMVEKVSSKFAKTFCNTSNFGISDEGAIEFAVGETTKQFSNNKLIKSLDFQKLNKKIISNIESDCQVFDFPITELSKLEIIKN